jgi:hypothetical protein
MPHDFYTVLGLRPGATDVEIKAAFRFIENIQGVAVDKSVCSAAFGVLGNAFSRSAYDSVHGFSSQPTTARRDIDGSAIDVSDRQISAYVNLPREPITSADYDDAPPCLDSHRYKRSPRKESDLYTCFGAASAGCLPCVRYLIEVRGVSLTAKSDRGKYTLEGFAQWGFEHRDPHSTATHSDVLQYLHQASHSADIDAIPLSGVWAPESMPTDDEDL